MLNAVSIEFRYQQSPLGPTSSDIDYCPIRPPISVVGTAWGPRPTSYVKHSPPDVRKCPSCGIKSSEWPNNFEMPTTRYLTAISHSVSKLAVNISSRWVSNHHQWTCPNRSVIIAREYPPPNLLYGCMPPNQTSRTTQTGPVRYALSHGSGRTRKLAGHDARYRKSVLASKHLLRKRGPLTQYIEPDLSEANRKSINDLW